MTKVAVPRRLLLDTDLSASARLVWMLLRLTGDSSTGQMHDACRLAATTIRRAMSELQRAGWRDTVSSSGERAWIPGELVLDRRLGVREKVLYGVLQCNSDVNSSSGRFTYSSLAVASGLSVNTVKAAVRRLHQAGWLQVAKSHKLRPHHFTLRNPVDERYRHAVAGIDRRMAKAKHKGEALMREYLSLVIASDHYDDDASPGFLINPYTGEEMQFDRHYPPHAAFEFQGAQHDGPTDLYPDPDEARKQQARDHMKVGICKRQNIELVHIYPDDLSFNSLREKVPTVLPLRDLARDQRLVAYLERLGRAYREEARPQ